MWGGCTTRICGCVSAGRPTGSIVASQIASQSVRWRHNQRRPRSKKQNRAGPRRRGNALAQGGFETAKHGRTKSLAPELAQFGLDFTDIQDLFPAARQNKRRVIGHFGPTNSGKTHTAIKALLNAECGAYCGPLRLLACEMYEKMSASNSTPQRICALATGQQLIEPDNSTHLSCTVEMLSLNPQHEVVVIDEIQKIADPERGWAWTRALLGSPAREVHVCGDPAAEPLVRDLLDACGENLEVQRYERLSPLSVDGVSAVQNITFLRPGDCVIAFSRSKLYDLKAAIEQNGQKCCIVYGGLPPHARREQARLFNDPDSGYDILVATDAIGMGLNLNIGRVIFSGLEKFNGTEVVFLPSADVKQIAGRAGRFGTKYANGRSLVLGDQRSAAELSRRFHAPIVPLKKAGFFPTDRVLMQFVHQAEARLDRKLKFSHVINAFIESLRLDGDRFFLCRNADWHTIAALIDDIELALEDRLTLCKTPGKMTNDRERRAVLDIAQQLSEVYQGRRTTVLLPTLLNELGLDVQLANPYTGGTPRDKGKLADLENACRMIDLYIWLGNRYECFTDLEKAEQLYLTLTDHIDHGLADLSKRGEVQGTKFPKRRSSNNTHTTHKRSTSKRGSQQTHGDVNGLKTKFKAPLPKIQGADCTQDDKPGNWVGKLRDWVGL
eukprot:m.394141 g.394141  ORF g.394141 m.394141 type:complete len:667 (+) comp16766_c0_seq20:3904-5904(+)